MAIFGVFLFLAENSEKLRCAGLSLLSKLLNVGEWQSCQVLYHFIGKPLNNCISGNFQFFGFFSFGHAFVKSLSFFVSIRPRTVKFPLQASKGAARAVRFD